MAIVLTDNKHYTDIADAIKNNDNTIGQLFSSEMAEAVNQACNKQYDKGTQKIWESFKYQPNGTERTNWAYKFYNWNEDAFYPPYDIPVSNSSYMFEFFNQYGTPFNLTERLTECGSSLDFSLCTSYMIETFYGAYITHIPWLDFSNITLARDTFYSKELKRIEGITSNENITWTNPFNNCTALSYIRFDGVIGKDINFKDCPLDKASVESIYNALSSSSTGKTLTLNKNAVNTAFGINVDDLSTWAEGSEYYTLRHSKDNWTVNYI